jgi:hypothetical protein
VVEVTAPEEVVVELGALPPPVVVLVASEEVAVGLVSELGGEELGILRGAAFMRTRLSRRMGRRESQ